MSMPFFSPGDHPGASFTDLLRRVGLEPFNLGGSPSTGHAVQTSHVIQVPHATTCVALRFADGVVMAGDRRATSGNLISHRSMEKVVPADRFSGVAIAGAAGPAMEMITLFQLQLEHYEKVEGQLLSLEGKANQLSMLVRGNLPAAMQGMVVVPIFAGYDLKNAEGRLWDYDPTGGRYEEREFVATGSGSLHAGTVVKLGWHNSMSQSEAVALAVKSLWEAADVDSATGGPDALRGIYPVVASVTAEGWTRVDDAEISGIVDSLIADHRARNSSGGERS
jgi:proteasome beta subunit